ncbi:putative J domain-containing protein [Escovopsis weberi]|uniref:Putative J domain-containing protein n=1 Tax=Escovopsis weberi TaxID=150374 RepID=A0A0M9VTJ7_ESCWE|nr:putative J domain-containing protein [Escovopsis weberi]
MKISYLAIGLLSLLTPLTAAWSKEDREIFRIRDEIAAHETDPSATFYDILGVAASASQDDINKAYRQKSRSLHPDKVKQQLKAERVRKVKGAGAGAGAVKPPSAAEVRKAVKDASDRQARLSLIAGILRGPSRDRYDHFLANGFPLWKGTDYYYNRYRPGLGTVMLGLFFTVGGGIHYLALYMSWKRQKEFVERYVTFARNAAWGNSAGIPNIDALAAAAAAAAPAPAPEDDEAEGSEAGPPQPMNRRQRRFQEKESRKEDGRAPKKSRKAALQASKKASREQSATRPAGVRKRVVAENGKVLVVDSQGYVFLEGEDEDGNVNEYLLDPNELAQPTFRDTAVVRVPVWLFRSSVGRFLPNNEAAEGETAGEQEVGQIEAEGEDAAQAIASSDSAGDDFEMVDQNAETVGRAKASGAQQGGKASKRKTKKR